MGTPRTKEPDPDLGQGVVDKDRYLSPDIAAGELDRIFRRSWLYAVPAGDVREPGSWAVFDLGPESVRTIRTDSGPRSKTAQLPGSRTSPAGTAYSHDRRKIRSSSPAAMSGDR